MSLGEVPLRLTLTDQQAAALDRMVSTGLYGRNRSAAVGRILSEAILESCSSGILKDWPGSPLKDDGCRAKGKVGYQ